MPTAFRTSGLFAQKPSKKIITRRTVLYAVVIINILAAFSSLFQTKYLKDIR
jgi:hypothetical protein